MTADAHARMSAEIDAAHPWPADAPHDRAPAEPATAALLARDYDAQCFALDEGAPQYEAVAIVSPPSAAPATPIDERIVRHPFGHLTVERAGAWTPTREQTDAWLASCGKAWPVLADHAPHIDGEFEGALTNLRRGVEAFHRYVKRVRAADPVPVDYDGEVVECPACEGFGHPAEGVPCPRCGGSGVRLTDEPTHEVAYVASPPQPATVDARLDALAAECDALRRALRLAIDYDHASARDALDGMESRG